MNTKRYVAAGAVSLLVHSMFLAAMPTKDPITLTMGSDTPHVSLTFVAVPPAVAKTPPSTVTPVSTPTESVPTKSAPVKPPVISTMKRLAKTATVDKTVSKKAPTLKKTAPPKKKTAPPIKNSVTPIKNVTSVKKKQLTHKKPLKQTSSTVTTMTDTKTALKSTKALSNQSNKTAATAVDNAGTQALQLVSKPTFVTRPGAVNYPKLAKRRGIEGQVLIEVWIGIKGQQLKQKLIKSSGAHILDNAAITAIKKWHFSSHIVNGKAIAHRVQIPVRFKLD